MTIHLVDSDITDLQRLSTGGHQTVYARTLSKIKGTSFYLKSERFTKFKKNPLLSLQQKKTYLKPLHGKKVVHFLYADMFYLTPTSFKELKKSGCKIIATLHWYPNNKIKLMMLKIAATYIDVIVVHSEYIKMQLNKAGINQVITINYPVFYPLSKKMEIDKDHTHIRIICLGSTRYDKGLDILGEAFTYIDDSIKDKIIFMLIGGEAEIKYVGILQKAKEYNITVEVDLKKVSDEAYWQYLIKSDVLLLPYRKSFTGNSGPMADAIYVDKYIIGPEEGNLGYMINKHHLGSTFNIENPQSIAEAIYKMTTVDLHKNHAFKKEMTVIKFLKQYEQLYENISK